MTDFAQPGEGAPPARQRRVRVAGPASVLAVIPPLLGFEPSEPSLVVVGVAAPNPEVRVTFRLDIPDARRAAAAVRTAIGFLAVNDITAAVVVGYGPGDLVDPVAREVLRRFPGAGIGLTDVLRAHDQRYWSYLCQNPRCCPPDGTPFDAKSHPAAAMFAGRPVLASRQALAQTIAPPDGQEAAAMRQATRRATARARRLIKEAGNPARPGSRRRALRGPGLEAVAEAIAAYREGGSITEPDDVAWLALALRELPVRDDAWARMSPEHNAAHRRLWADVTRLAPRGFAAAPASLLAFCAWQAGDGALANIALDRALADDRRYSMARLLRQALDSGAPPSTARLPMSPEEVAACYIAADGEADDDRAGSDLGRGEDAERTAGLTAGPGDDGAAGEQGADSSAGAAKQAAGLLP